VSARTVARRRIEIDLHTYVRRHEHAFTELDLKRRISFAEGYSRWAEDDWRRVLWTPCSPWITKLESTSRVRLGMRATKSISDRRSVWRAQSGSGDASAQMD
jgi:hypothetical protein